MVHYEKYDLTKARNDKAFEKFLMTVTRRGSYGKKAWVQDEQEKGERGTEPGEMD
jgi:hypothetical protein